jgi:hypothetical protein
LPQIYADKRGSGKAKPLKHRGTEDAEDMGDQEKSHHGGTETRRTAEDWVKAGKQTLPLIIADATDTRKSRPGGREI